MKNTFSKFFDDMPPQTRNAARIALFIFVAAIFAVGGAILRMLTGSGNLSLLVVAVVAMIANLVSFWLCRRGQPITAVILSLGSIWLVFVVSVFTTAGTGLVLGTIGVLMSILAAGQTMPFKAASRVIGLSIVVGIIIFVLDLYGAAARPQTTTLVPILVIGAIPLIGTGFFIIREFRDYSLRTKFLISIVSINVVSIAIFGYFAYIRTQALQAFLTNELQLTVNQQSEQQLKSTVQAESHNADQLLSEITLAVRGVADYRAAIYSQASLLGNGSYWDGHTKLLKLPAGQHINAQSDQAAVFIPNVVPVLDDKLISDLNLSLNLDFSAPGVLKAHPNMAALYYMSAYDYVVYYPNFDVSVIPADLSSLLLPWYTDMLPENNPDRKVLWSDPYQDPAGSGLIITDSAPVYDQNGVFRGVIAADVQLSKIASNISTVRIAKSGFAFLLDHAGHIIAMPDPGYALLGLKPEVVAVNESPKMTILGQGTAEFQDAVRRMTLGENGLSIVKIADAEYYIVYTPLPTVGYSLGALVPALEMNDAFLTARTKIEAETKNTLNFAAIVLLVLLLVVTGFSILFSQYVARPLVALAKIAQAIAGGDINLLAKVESKDEIGTLAGTFNNMTKQLRDLIGSLEKRVADRTKALQTSTEVSRRISTILDEKLLVSEVVEQVQGAFGYYHAHIYILDESTKELIMAGGTGETGKIMLARGHKIALGKGLVGLAAQNNLVMRVADVATEPQWLSNPLLPDTRSEVAVPIAIANHVLGVLDVQDNMVGTLKQEDVDVLQSIANQVAFAVRNARAYSEVQANADRELLITSIGQKIQDTTTVESALKVAVREIGRALQGAKAQVVLNENAGTNDLQDREDTIAQP